LELENRNEVILERNRTIADAEEVIQQQNREIRILNEQIRMLASRVEQLSMEKQQLSMQLVEKEIRETEISQEIDDVPAWEEDLVAEIENGIGEAEISQEIAPLLIHNPGLDVELIENSRDYKGSEEEEEMTGSDIKSVDLEIREEVEFPGDETEIKRLPKRGSQKRMRKK
jgi:TolA-binding protein